VAGFCERGDEPSDSIKKGYFLIRCVTISFANNILHHGVIIPCLFNAVEFIGNLTNQKHFRNGKM
jgi:hypothetical protein